MVRVLHPAWHGTAPPATGIDVTKAHQAGKTASSAVAARCGSDALLPVSGRGDDEVLAARRAQAVGPAGEIALGQVPPRDVTSIDEAGLPGHRQDLLGREEADERRARGARTASAGL